MRSQIISLLAAVATSQPLGDGTGDFPATAHSGGKLLRSFPGATALPELAPRPLPRPVPQAPAAQKRKLYKGGYAKPSPAAEPIEFPGMSTGNSFGGSYYDDYGDNYGGNNYGDTYYGGASIPTTSDPPPPPGESPPPWPPAVPGAGYASTVSFSYTYEFIPGWEDEGESTAKEMSSPADIDAYYPGGRANFTASLELQFRREYFPNATSITVTIVPQAGRSQSQRRRMTDGTETGAGTGTGTPAVNPRGPINLEVKVAFGTAAEAVLVNTRLQQGNVQSTLVEAAAFEAPSPPPPPLPPFELQVCENTCTYTDGRRATFNGVCEEAPGTFLSVQDEDGAAAGRSCAFGTDCADCGVREVCSEASGCPTTCRERSWSDALADVHALRRAGNRQGQAALKPFCSENILGDGRCDPHCNNWECNHDMGDCDLLTDALTKCAKEQSALEAFYTMRPGNHSSLTQQTFGSLNVSKPAEVELRVLSFPPFSLELGSAGWSIAINPIKLQLKWRDSRLPSSPCRQVLPLLYTLAQGTERDTVSGRHRINALMKLIWFPRVEVAGVAVDDFSINTFDTLPKKILASQFSAQAGSEWWGANSTVSKPRDGAETCFDCATLTMENAVSFSAGPLLTGFDFYPFDRQKLVFSLRVNGAHVFNCEIEHFLNQEQINDPESVLPITGEWNIDGPITARRGKTLQADGTYALDDSICDLVVPVQRNYAMFLIKQGIHRHAAQSAQRHVSSHELMIARVCVVAPCLSQ